MTDIAIIGGGPAGLTAALYAARAGKSVLLLERESFGGQIVLSPMVDNFPASPHISGADFAARLYEQVDSFSVAMETEEVQKIEKTADGFRLTTDFGTHEAKAVILATGVRHRSLGLPEEEDLVGAGISYCAVCDGAFYRDADVAVVGGGDTALQDALFLSDFCRFVTLIHRRDTFRAEAALVKKVLAKENIRVLYSHTPERFVTKDGALSGIVLNDLKAGEEREIAVRGVFLAVGQKPQNEAFADLLTLDEHGYLRSGEDAQTNVPGIFAAGDCRTKTVRQLTTAVGDGAAAAMAACRYIES